MTVPALPGAEARELYGELVAGGGMFDLAEVAARQPAALAELRAAGLVVELHDGQWGIADPRRAAGWLRAQYRVSAVELLLRAEEPAQALEELALAYERAPLPEVTQRPPITHVENVQEIQRRVKNLVLTNSQEVLTMQPGGARPPEFLAAMREDVRRWRGRGIEMRTVYQPGARTDPGTAAYAAYASSLGASVRILDEPFRRLFVFDRKVAVMAGHPTYEIATFVEDPVLVGVLVEQFERDWSRAERVRWAEPVASPLVALLAQGLTQAAIAKRLGLSERTVASQIARLREEYDADTLFQLGWVMGEKA